MQICQMQKKTTKIRFKVGDLEIYKPLSAIKIQLGIIVKAKTLLNLYDVLIQTENIYLKDINGDCLSKAD